MTYKEKWKYNAIFILGRFSIYKGLLRKEFEVQCNTQINQNILQQPHNNEASLSFNIPDENFRKLWLVKTPDDDVCGHLS